MVSDARALRELVWNHVVYEGAGGASPAAMAAAGLCSRHLGATFISDGGCFPVLPYLDGTDTRDFYLLVVFPYVP